MPEVSQTLDNVFILYEDRHFAQPQPAWLTLAHWQAQGQRCAPLGGRGQVWQVETPLGSAVLRRFQRGGWVRHVCQDRYLYLGQSRSRAIREFRLLQHLRRLQLPVPEPLAASCERHGLTYRCALLTREIVGAQTLSQLAAHLDSQAWVQLGQLLARFFSAGLHHPDLNANNVMRDEAGQWWLLDFDKASLKRAPTAADPMIQRLQRSLAKQEAVMNVAALKQGLRSSA